MTDAIEEGDLSPRKTRGNSPSRWLASACRFSSLSSCWAVRITEIVARRAFEALLRRAEVAQPERR
ncbi:hypothetical protein ACU4HD_42375 [Cupriavidus basilensis]